MTDMQVTLIKLGGATVGAAEYSANGVPTLAWFHANCRAYSMAHAIDHEGYSTADVQEIDCHDVAGILESIAARLGIALEIAFVPFSQSRHKGDVWEAGNGQWKAGLPRHCFNWRVTWKRNGREFLSHDYSSGVAISPNYGKKVPHMWNGSARDWPYRLAEFETESGFAARGFTMGSVLSADRKRPILPKIGDVIHSVITDSSVLDAGGFDSWAQDLGFDPDSRKAEAIYRECMETATKLQSAIGPAAMAELRLVSRFN